MSGRPHRGRRWALVGAALLVPSLAVAAAPVREARVEVVVGVAADGRLTAVAAPTASVPVPPSRVAGVGGYAGRVLRFRSLAPGEERDGVRALDPEAHVAFELVYADRGVAVLADDGRAPMRRLDLFKLGAASFETAPLWMLDADVRRPSQVTIRLIDRAGVHEPGRALSFLLAPDPTVEAWVCAAHCEDETAYPAPGRCPVCGAPLALATTARFTARVDGDRPLRVGEPSRLAIGVRDPSGAPVALEEGGLDVFVVAADLASFAHGRPARNAAGTFAMPASFPAPGLYTVFLAFTAPRVGPQVAATDVVVSGTAPAREPLEPDAAASKVVDGYEIGLRADGPLRPLRKVTLTFAVARGGAPVQDLETWRDAIGHLAVVRGDRTHFVHRAARVRGGTRGPELAFGTVFPADGLYRMWLQFKHRGTVVTVPFTVAVGPWDSLRGRTRADEGGMDGAEDEEYDEDADDGGEEGEGGDAGDVGDGGE